MNSVTRHAPVDDVESRIRERLTVLSRIRDTLTQLRRMSSVQSMIDAAPQYACESCGFDRAVLYRVRGRELIAESFWVNGDPEAAAQLLASSRENPPLLASQTLETEMVRRRRPLGIKHLSANPRVLAELTDACHTDSYVAAPIMPEGRVIGFIHADHRLKPRSVDEFDRDCLSVFAEGFGYAVERAQLIDRLRAQGQELGRLLQQTEMVVAGYLEAGVELVHGDSETTGSTRSTPAVIPIIDNRLARELTKREIEVLALLGAGASNANIAARLCISTDTAKSHVKRIFRKLGAANRVEAAAIWLQTKHRLSPELGGDLQTG